MSVMLLKRELHGNIPYYEFQVDGNRVKMHRDDAVEFISKVPAEDRNCKVSFNSVMLKVNWKKSHPQFSLD